MALSRTTPGGVRPPQREPVHEFTTPRRPLLAMTAFLVAVAATSQSILASTDGSLGMYCGPSVVCNASSTDNAIPLTISKESEFSVGTIQLEVHNHGSGDIRILNSDKSAEQYSVAASALPVTLYVQGIAVSGEVDDVQIEGEWTSGQTFLGAALISLTVVEPFKGKVIPGDDFPGRSYDRLGVGETGTLGVELAEGVNLNDWTPLTWTITAGTALTIDNRNTDAGTATFVAGDLEGEVTLTLTDKNNRQLTYTITVIHPSAGKCVRAGGTNVWKEMTNRYSIGLATDFYLQPTDVSFTNTFFREGWDIGEAHGWFKDKAGMDGKEHPECSKHDWCHVGDGNIVDGCKVLWGEALYDRAYGTQDPTPLPYSDDSWFEWDIPWLYTTNISVNVAEDENRVWLEGCRVLQRFTVNAQGVATLRKDDSETVSNRHEYPEKGWFDYDE